MQSFFLTDEELGKKDDDHKGSKHVLRPKGWAPARAPQRKSIKRLFIALIIGLAVYLFIKNIPTDVGIRDRRRPAYYHPSDNSDLKPNAPANLQAPPSRGKTSKTSTPAESSKDHTYNGPLRFLNLAASLHGIAGTRGGYLNNKNVLFAAASLKSAATLLPIACQMGAERQNYVHFALMSRSEISLAELGKLNGIDEPCHIIFHDARPDSSSISTDDRLESSTARALYHIHMYMHPQAVIVDGSDTEESFFTKGIRKTARASKIALIEMPHNAAKSLSWMTRLESASLAAWNQVSIDILIHATLDASGSLVRLLKSLSSADFTAGSIPHLTIELPQKIDLPTEKFLESFQWPPSRAQSPTNSRLLSLRHRIPRQGVSEDESSARFLESFWPVDPQHSHVLVLSPQAEVSSNFFSYLKYTVLHYRYSNTAMLEQWDQRLFGISLDLPSTNLDASTAFTAPAPLADAKASKDKADEVVSFLWQAPNSNAMLFMGQRWVEMHSFVSHLLNSEKHQSSPFLATKNVSKKYPAWLEHVLRLCRARGYWTLYPGKTTASKLATIHTELYTAPEEYEKEFTADSGDESEVELVPGSLLEHLPNKGSLAPFNELPLLAWDGKKTALGELDSASLKYAADFKQQIGGCDDAVAKQQAPHKFADDLFCIRGKNDKSDINKERTQSTAAKSDPPIAEKEAGKQGTVAQEKAPGR